MPIHRRNGPVAGRQVSTWINDRNDEYITLEHPDPGADTEEEKAAEDLYVYARTGRFMCVDRKDYVYSLEGLLAGRGPRYMQTLARRVKRDLEADNG